MTETEKILLKYLGETMLIAETLRDDYTAMISQVTNISLEETKERINHLMTVNAVKIEFKLKDYLDSLPPDERTQI